MKNGKKPRFLSCDERVGVKTEQNSGTHILLYTTDNSHGNKNKKHEHVPLSQG